MSDHAYAAHVLAFFTASVLLLSGGRLGSADAYTQLQAAMLVAETGSLGAARPPDPVSAFWWVKSPGGRYYPAADVGNNVLMLPSALLTRAVSDAPPGVLVRTPPVWTRALAALTASALGALGLFWVFRLFRRFVPRREAFLLAVLFAVATPFAAYTKSCWDVVGGCVGVCLMLSASARLLTEERPGWGGAAWLGAGLAVLGSFRYSAAPFLALGAGLLYLTSLDRLRRGHAAAFLAVAGLGLAPMLVYNQVRIGTPLLPATTAPQYAFQNGMGGNLLEGVFGMTLHPNTGLLWFCPLLVLIGGLPVVWSRLPVAARRLIVAYGVTTVPYTLVIANKSQWFTFGWATRYLIPMLPVLFFAAAMVLVRLWDRHRKALGALVGLSVLVNLPAEVANWPHAIATYSGAVSTTTLAPRMQMAVWDAVLLGLRGDALPAAPKMDSHGEPAPTDREGFPNLWTVHLMRHSRPAAAVGVAGLLVLLGTSAVLLARLLSAPPVPDPPPEP